MAKRLSGSTGRRGTARSKLSTAPVSGAQRRQVTVLFCDLVKSAELTERLDPEDARDVVHAYLNAFALQIETAGGFIARYMGDGVMAYFGYPLARDGDPARAIRAALAICEAARTLQPPHGQKLSVRCGVATGLTVIGDLVGKGAASERGVIGSAPNLAARLQSAAGPGQTVICATTARLTSGIFERTPLKGLELKGFAKPEAAFAVAAAGSTGESLARRLAFRLAPLSGRANEFERLIAAWRRAKSGRTTFVPIVGEAGIGKSRLIYEFQQMLHGEPHHWFEAAADPSLDGAAYATAARLALSLAGGEAGELTLGRLEALLDRAGVKTALAPLGALLGLSDTQDGPTLSAEDRRRRLNAAFASWLTARTRERPTVMVIEDLQWVDPSSMELLEHLLAARAGAPLLVLGSSRTPQPRLDRYAAPVHPIRLDPLTDPAIGSIVSRIAGPDVAPETLQELVKRSDGNPFFAEELAAHLVAAPARIGALPETLIGLLTARLDATGPAATLARVASVLGPKFDTDLLRRLTRLPAHQVRDELKTLVRAKLMTQHGARHAFRHALIHEAAYESLLRDDRRALHRRAAVLLAKSGAPADAVARHWREAGDLRRAADAYRELGRAYVADGAHGEAAQAYRAALDMLSGMPSSVERDREEMEIGSALTNSLQITDGYSAPAAVAAAAHARALAERLGDAGKLFNQVAAEWMAASSAGDYIAARKHAARAMPLAEADGSPDTLGTAFMIQMTSAYRVGALAEGEAAYRAGSRHFRTAAFARRPGAVPQTVGNGAVNAWLLGRAAAARRRNAQVVLHGDRAKAPYVRAFAYYMAAMTFVLMDEPADAERLAREAMHISDSDEFPQFAATARIVLGRALAMQGRRRAGLALMRDGLDRMAVNRSRNGLTMYLTWLAQTHLERRDLAAARGECEAALAANPSERFFRAETLRVQALCSATPADRAAGLAEALAVARSTGSGWAEARILSSAAHGARPRPASRRA